MQSCSITMKRRDNLILRTRYKGSHRAGKHHRLHRPTRRVEAGCRPRTGRGALILTALFAIHASVGNLSYSSTMTLRVAPGMLHSASAMTWCLRSLTFLPAS